MSQDKSSGNVVAAVDDMFFAAKIRATGEASGITVRIARNKEEAIRLALEERPALIIVDLHSQRCSPFELGVELKRDKRLRNVPLLGFFSHVQTELKQRAEEAGYDRVLPRSAFSAKLSKILEGRF